MTLARVLSYNLLPLILAAVHILLDRQVKTPVRRVEVFLLYWLGIAVGANGLGGFFGHMFLSDMVAESVGWPAGSPFQLEMGFANLAMGMLGIVAISRTRDFRLATALAVSILSFGAIIVHVMDIVATGNLAPGNTVQNLGNFLRPTLLITLLAISDRQPAESTKTDPDYARWHNQQSLMVGFAAAGLGTGFGVGFAVDQPFLYTVGGTLLGIGIGLLINRRSGTQSDLATG